MKGGFLHCEVLAHGVAEALRKAGARVAVEYPTRPGPRSPAMDIYAELRGLRIGVEIELEPRRVARDLAKAAELDLDLLIIVTATRAQAQAITRTLRDTRRPRVPVRVAPFGAAIRLLSELSGETPLLNGGTRSRDARPQKTESRTRDSAGPPPEDGHAP